MKNKLFILLIYALTMVQSISAQTTITGTVINQSGEAVPGANVRAKGFTDVGTITDLDGVYSLDVPSEATHLIFSFVGMKTKEIEITNQTVINVSLETEDVGIDEVVVTALGITRKRMSVSYAVQTIQGEGITKIKKSPKTWKRSNKSVNAVCLTIGDDENDTIPLVGTEMQVTVDGFRARVLLNYYFYSETSNYEGTFKIRLPMGASPYYFAFGPTIFINKDNSSISYKNYYNDKEVYVNNERIKETKLDSWKQPKEAKVVPKEKAAFAYTETVRGQIDPLLAEWGEADVFNCQVFPIQANQMHRVVIGYDVDLTNIKTDKVFNLNIPKTKTSTIIDIDVANLHGDKTIFSYSKNLKHKNNRTSLHLENPEMEELLIRYKNTEAILLTDMSEDYFASSFIVNLPQKAAKAFSTDAIFVLDISASSNPDKFNVWLKLLKSVLENNKTTIKHFNILFFNIETSWYSDVYLKNNSKNINSLMNYCDKLSLEGATDIGAAISEVCNPNWKQKKHKKNIFLLSDGSVTWGKDELYSISSIVDKNNRIYVYNTGISGTDMNLLEHLSRESGGALFSVTGEDEIKAASTAFNYNPWEISSIEFGKCSDILIQGRPKYIYSGQKLVISGRGIPGKRAKLSISTKNEKQIKKLEYTFTYPLVSNLTKRVYGQLAVNQIENFDFITKKLSEAYAVAYKVPGKTCSMLMLENEEDYKRYNINLKKDLNIVKDNKVNVIVHNAINKLTESEGLEKDKFLNQLSKLSNTIDVSFELSETIKALIDNTPAEDFRIEPEQIICRNHFKSEFSDDVKKQLKEENPKYYYIEKEADTLEQKFGKYDALKMLSTIVERNSGNAKLLRDVAYSAMRLGLSEHAFYLFKKVTEKMPNQPHSYQAIAQILTEMQNYDLALIYYELAYSAKWNQRFGSFNEIIGLDYLRFLRLVKNSKKSISNTKFVKDRLKELEVMYKTKAEKINLMITINWNTDNSDIDLHVIEPSGEECFYSHSTTKSGGSISRDVTGGFGPEMYTNPAKINGNYKIKAKYFSDNSNRASTRTQVYIVIYEDWGKANEKITRKVISLKDKQQMHDIMELNVD